MTLLFYISNQQRNKKKCPNTKCFWKNFAMSERENVFESKKFAIFFLELELKKFF